MVGCNIIRACEAGDMASDSAYCRPFDMLATTCIDPGMSRMGGCAVYTPLCLTRGSVVEQCNQQQGVPRLVGTSQSQVRPIAQYTSRFDCDDVLPALTWNQKVDGVSTERLFDSARASNPSRS